MKSAVARFLLRVNKDKIRSNLRFTEGKQR